MLKVESNKRYMQSAAFWQEAHNKQAAELVDRLIFQRDMLGTISANSPKDFFQRTDGFIEPIQKTGFFKFLKGPGYYEKKFAESMNKEYALIKSDLSNLSQQAKKKLKQEGKALNIEV